MTIHSYTEWDRNTPMAEEMIAEVASTVIGNRYKSKSDGKLYYGPMCFAVLNSGDWMANNMFSCIDNWRRNGEIEPLDSAVKKFFEKVPHLQDNAVEIARRVVSSESTIKE